MPASRYPLATINRRTAINQLRVVVLTSTLALMALE